MLLVAHVLCSDPECAELEDAVVESLEELDALACACGCTWELVAVSLDATEVAALA